jgi:AcrR family transcriptional regulator
MDDSDRTTRALLRSALAEFGARGFAKTSLTQIASAAKVSRPTLYARYPDKVSLFRAVVQGCYDDALAAAGEAATVPGSFEVVLCGVLLGYFGTLFERLHGLPMIDELALAGSEEAEDVVLAARDRFRGLLAKTLREQLRCGSVDPERMAMPAAQLVDLIRFAPASLKTPKTTRAQYRRGLENFARLVAQAVGRA